MSRSPAAATTAASNRWRASSALSRRLRPTPLATSATLTAAPLMRSTPPLPETCCGVRTGGNIGFDRFRRFFGLVVAAGKAGVGAGPRRLTKARGRRGLQRTTGTDAGALRMGRMRQSKRPWMGEHRVCDGMLLLDPPWGGGCRQGWGWGRAPQTHKGTRAGLMLGETRLRRRTVGSPGHVVVSRGWTFARGTGGSCCSRLAFGWPPFPAWA